MQHVHVMDIRPDVITRTGVIQPYALREIPPQKVAYHSVQAFETTARPPGPQVRAEMQPEEFAARAKRVAAAMSAGKRMPRGSDPKLIHAARLIVEGKPFAIKSAGRAAKVEARRPSTWTALQRTQPASAGIRVPRHETPEPRSVALPAAHIMRAIRRPRPRWTARGWRF